ncbi:EAL domain-containing protein [Halomonas aquamarina]|uniref:EAL domain-containing protein n=1 Tax=Vreelandella aquamarina TaxID=77097 RepID=A0ACC5VUP4_9GAMM|nr:EAL domain-containing protein [Halomonas aquamarina]
MNNLQAYTYNENNNHNYTIAIQPIVDGDLKHIADELLYRANESSYSADISDDLQATARACAVAIYEIGIVSLCGQRQLFINASHQWLTDPDLRGLPADQIVIEVLENTPATDEVIASLQHLRQQGYTIALDDFVANEDSEKLLPYCDIVKIDISTPVDTDLVSRLLSRGVTLLAERVETQADFKACQQMGFTLFQGYFYEKPIIQASSSIRRTASRANQLQLLASLYKERTSLTDIADLIIRDPYLLSAIFKRANSADKGAHKPTARLVNCLQILGIRELRTLVSILMMASNSPASRLNLINGLTRGFTCELMAEQRNLDGQEGFIVGLFSLMPTIMETDLNTLLQEVRLGRDIEKALTSQAGALGRLLQDIQSAESGEPPSDFPTDALLRAAKQARMLIDAHSAP